MPRDLCPTCGHELADPGHRLTERELDVLAAYWVTDSVKQAAAMCHLGEQRAKNLLYRARIRNAAPNNDTLVSMHYGSVRSRALRNLQHNLDGKEAA